MPGCVRRANNYARKIIDRMVQSQPGPFSSAEISTRLNAANKARGFVPQRVACLLRERDDLRWVRSGMFEKVENPAMTPITIGRSECAASEEIS